MVPVSTRVAGERAVRHSRNMSHPASHEPPLRHVVARPLLPTPNVPSWGPQPEPEIAPDPRRWFVLALLCLCLLMIVLDNTILNVAIPTLVKDLGASDSALQWIADGYTITFAGLLLLGGALGDRQGRRGWLQVGLIIFGLGSFAAANSGTTEALIASRIVMGVGGALVMPATLSLVTQVFPPRERATAVGIWTAIAGLGVALGPLIGGYLVEHYHWGAVFLVNLPVVALVLLVSGWLLPTFREFSPPPIDAGGAALSTVAIVLVLYGIIEGPAQGWTSPYVLAALAAGTATGVWFARWERSRRHPLLELSLFRDRAFTLGSVAITLVFFAMFGSMFLATQYFQFVLGHSAFQSGLRLLPFALAVGVVAPNCPRVVARIGYRRTITLGLLICAVALYLLTDLRRGMPDLPIIWRLVLLGLGMGFVMPAATEAVLATLPEEKAGIGSAMNDLTRELGGALGIAVLGSILVATYRPHVRAALDPTAVPPEYVDVAEKGVGQTLAVAKAVKDVSVMPGPDHLPAAVSGLARETYVGAMHAGFIVAAGAALLGAVLVFALMEPWPVRRRARRSAMSENEAAIAASSGGGSST